MRASLSCEDRGWVSGDRVLAHSRWQPSSKALLYKQGNQSSKGPITGCARGPGRAGWEHATDCTKIRPSLHPGSPCAAVSKDRPLLPYWEVDSNTTGRGCLVAEHSGHAGPVLLHLALMSVPRPPKGAEAGLGPSQAENWAAGANHSELHTQHLPGPPGLGKGNQCQMVPNRGCPSP